jgi:hypothetical protein
MLKGLLAAGGACALVAGAAVAGTAAHATSASAPRAAASTDVAGISAGDDLLTALDAASGGTDAGAGTPSGTPAAARLPPWCAKLPTAIQRTQNREKRLAADASTPGSLAYLQHRIDTVRSAHHDELVATLEKRMAFRRQLAAFLPQRLALLQKAETTICSAAAVPTPGAS